MELLYAALLGPIASWIQGDFLKDSKRFSPRTKKRLRLAMSVLAALAAGFLAHSFELLNKNNFSWDKVLADFGIAFAMSQAFYQTHFKLIK